MNVKNVAIIAHVDHGKTTLVNKLIEVGIKDKHQVLADRVLDSDTLEREKGITILAKNTAVYYKDYKINILDTPGHADFGGEVERIMHMVDGVLLVVDAFEGVMPQTRFVLQKALEKNKKPIVIVNKIDRENIDIRKSLNEVYDLFIDLGASEEDLDFPIVYGSGLIGKMSLEPKLTDTGMEVIFDEIIKHIPSPKIYDNDHFLFQPSLIDYNTFVGRQGIGLILSGSVKVGQELSVTRLDDKVEKFKVQKIIQNIGISKVEVQEASYGDIVSIAGLADVGVGETITTVGFETKLPAIIIGEPTVEMTFGANSSPFAGKEGTHVTASKLKARLEKEIQKDVSLKVSPSDEKDSWIVKGRGELHLGILIENMRREGFEFQVSKPKVVIKEIDGEKYEPYEKAFIDVPNESMGSVIEILSSRNGKIEKIDQGNSYTKINYIVPSRSLIGFSTTFLTLTKGYGIINHSFHEYRPMEKIENVERLTGALIASSDGFVTEYALKKLEDRGMMFVEPRTHVYEGMIVGENNKNNDLVINPTQEKQLTNVRQANKEATVVLKRAKVLSLEESLSFINNDELIEITPKSIRLRKKFLKEHERKRNNKI
ncbi:translational GTPase TypA [Haploplasma modicum]|jgi:GTP-binding protein|nr:translational GTPase TypA [Haploplasma modicum]